MERGMTADQVLAAIWRRKVLVGAITAGVFAVGAAIVASLPSVYTSTVVVRVEPQRPEGEMVRRTVSEAIEQRLLTVRQELLARPVLQRAIEELNLYPELVADYGIEAAVEKMREDLEVKVEGETAFELTYSAEDPEVAAKVANRLPAVWSEETLKIRQHQAQRATTLFTDEVNRLKLVVADWERKVAQYKVDHIGELPEQMEANMRWLDRLSGQLSMKMDSLRSAEVRRSELARSRAAGDSEAGRMQAAESSLHRALVAARTQWTEDHPEVQRLENELAVIQQRREEAENSMVVERRERVLAAQSVESLKAEIEELRNQAVVFQKRLENTPKWAQGLEVLNRDYELARAKYNSVVTRQLEAELAQDLEAKSAATLFNVISPAGVPVVPASPDRMGGLVIALLIALSLGVLTAIVLELRDDSIRDSAELREQLPLPVLAVVPNMQSSKSEKRVLLPPPGGRNTVAPRTLN